MGSSSLKPTSFYSTMLATLVKVSAIPMACIYSHLLP